jgi:VWFA-related protein
LIARILSCFLIAAFFTATLASAQDLQSPAETLHITAPLVLLDVVVTDDKGAIVNNLSKDDFLVYENKSQQTIQSFEHQQSLSSQANLPISSTAELDRQEPNAPVSIIVLDEINTLFEDEAFARYSLKKYLNTQSDTLLQPTMLVAVNLERFMVLRDYTTSKKEILSALDHHLVEFPWHAKAASWKLPQYAAAFASLMEVAQATAGHPGHKNMIWVGRGFPAINETVMQSLPVETQDAIHSSIDLCTNALRDARVTMYTIDPAGINPAPIPTDENGFLADDPFGGNVDFEAMAQATGGKSYHGRNDVDHLIDGSVQAGIDFYTLSYVPAQVNDAAKPFRNIRVVMKNPALHATTREGYFTQKAALEPAEDAKGNLSSRLVFDLSIAGSSMMVYDSLPMTIERDPAAPDNFRIHIQASDIPWQSAGPQQVTSELTLLVESFDKKGKILNRSARIQHLLSKTNAAGTAPQSNALILATTIPTQPPAARIRFVVRVNANGKLGADNVFLIDRKTLSDPTFGAR